MRVICKAVLEPAVYQTVRVPKGGEFLEAREQLGDIVVWFMCDQAAVLEDKHLAVFATGQPLDEKKLGRYVGQAQLNNGHLIFHIFEAHRD